MKKYPLIRVKWSNEHIMAGVFLVLVLYQLPQWAKDPAPGIISFLILAAEGLAIDITMNLLRYHRIWCCVSGAVTAAMVCLLSYGVPLWGRMLGVAAALILGKHIWGGTGRNLINPALVGVLFLLLIFDIPYPFFPASWLILPAVILSLPFLGVRPFAGIGFILGMAAALFFNDNLTLMNLLTYGVFFWGCLVMTDPVTITGHPVAGPAAAFLAGFSALFYFPLHISVIAGILLVNLFSAAVESIYGKNPKLLHKRLKLRKVYAIDMGQLTMLDLTGEKFNGPAEESGLKSEVMKNGRNNSSAYDTVLSQLTEEEILNRIKVNEVFGMGGAAFSTYRKLMTVKTVQGNDRHLIINGVECDPGMVHDRWLLRNRQSQIITGVKLLNQCIGFASVQLAVKDADGLNYPEDLKLHKVPDYYPAGAERVLIAEVLGRQLDYDKIPAAEGILVLNVQTVYAVWQAVVLNKKVDTRFLTVADLKAKDVKVIRVKLGSKIHEVMEAVYPGTVNVFAGGGLMQAYPAQEEDVTDQNVNFIAASVFPKYKESPQCSSCGNCSRFCPAGLKVNLIADLVDKGKASEAGKYHAQECIECGSCSYNCLAGRNLTDRVKAAKNALKNGN